MADLNVHPFVHLTLSALACFAKDKPQHRKRIARIMQSVLDLDAEIYREDGDADGAD